MPIDFAEQTKKARRLKEQAKSLLQLVQDDVSVQSVTANITLPNASVNVILLTLATGNKYNTSFTIPNLTTRCKLSF